jgi:hypothetical protein
MQLSPDLLQQLTEDRMNDRQASAAASRIVATTPARMRIAQSLRRAADRLDATSTVPGRGTPASGVSAF